MFHGKHSGSFSSRSSSFDLSSFLYSARTVRHGQRRPRLLAYRARLSRRPGFCLATRPERPAVRRPTITVVGSARSSPPTDSTIRSTTPAAAHAAPCSAISSCALDPFIATSRPSVRMSGADHLTKRSRGATARESPHPPLRTPQLIAFSSARPRTTITLSGRGTRRLRKESGPSQ